MGTIPLYPVIAILLVDHRIHSIHVRVHLPEAALSPLRTCPHPPDISLPVFDFGFAARLFQVRIQKSQLYLHWIHTAFRHSGQLHSLRHRACLISPVLIEYSSGPVNPISNAGCFPVLFHSDIQQETVVIGSK